MVAALIQTGILADEDSTTGTSIGLVGKKRTVIKQIFAAINGQGSSVHPHAAWARAGVRLDVRVCKSCIHVFGQDRGALTHRLSEKMTSLNLFVVHLWM